MSELFGTELKENEKDKKELSIFENFSVKAVETPGQQYNLELFTKRTSNLFHIESFTSSKYPFKRIL